MAGAIVHDRRVVVRSSRGRINPDRIQRAGISLGENSRELIASHVAASAGRIYVETVCLHESVSVGALVFVEEPNGV